MVIQVIKNFFLCSSVYSCYLFLISSAFVRPLPFLFCIHFIFPWNVPLISPIFLKRSLVFPILFFPSIYLYCSFEKALLPLLAILWNSAFSWGYLSLSPLPFASFLSSAICIASSENNFAFLHFSFLGMVLVTTYCTMLQTSIHSSSGTLSTRSNPLNLFFISTV